jgi:hypothetical protein
MQDPKTSRLPQLVKKRLKRGKKELMSTTSHWKKNCCNPVNNFLLLGLAFGHGIHFTVSHQGSL